MSRPTVLSIALFVSAPLAAAQEEHTFSTGPLTGAVNAPLAPIVPPSDDFPSPLQGSDIKANPVTTGAQNETSLAVNPLNPLNWVGVANDYRTGNVETGWYTTLDGGQTWTSATFGIDAGWSFSGDPAVTFDNQGQVHVICMMYDGPGGVDRVRHFRSTNGGTAWNTGSIVGAVAGYDKPQVEADLSSGPHADDLLVAWDHFGAAFGDNVVVSVSTDSGNSWSPNKIINDLSLTAIGPDVAWGAGGEAYVMWADRGVNDVMFDRSFDGGVTWGFDKKVADFTHVPDFLPGSSFRVFDIFALHADQSSGPFSGNVHIAYHTWTAGVGNHRADVLVTTSTDQGATWSTGVKVTSDGAQQNDQLFPGIVVDRQGGVNVSYYDQRNDPNDDLLWTWISRSLDGGATWKDLQISDVGWNDNSTEFGGSFIGDYIDNEASSTGTLHPFWCDGRLGNTQDVYTDKVNLQLFTDIHSVSAATGGVVNFFIGLGPNVGGHNYILVASGSGTTPGVTLPGGVHVPLNHDFWTDLSISFAGTAIFPSSIGILNAGGAATAQMDTLGPFPGTFAGTNLDFSVVSISAGVATHASPATRVALVP